MLDAEKKPAAAAERIPFWLWPNVLALDAALVAVAWQHFFAGALRIKMQHPLQYLVLGVIVWVIYSADRLVDSKKLSRPDSASHRHRFYRRHFSTLLALTVLGAALAVYGVLTLLPQIILLPGGALGLLVVLYFVHRLNVRGPLLLVFPKEVFSGFVFALGATLLGFTLKSELPDAFWSMEVVCFGLLCALNCFAISVWERVEDDGNDPNSIAQLWPGSVAVLPWLAVGLTAGVGVLAFVVRDSGAFPLVLGSATGMALMAVLAFRAGRMSVPALRVLADVVVLLPALAYLPLVPWDSVG